MLIVKGSGASNEERLIMVKNLHIESAASSAGGHVPCSYSSVQLLHFRSQRLVF
jgi:hypothetical protein